MGCAVSSTAPDCSHGKSDSAVIKTTCVCSTHLYHHTAKCGAVRVKQNAKRGTVRLYAPGAVRAKQNAKRVLYTRMHGKGIVRAKQNAKRVLYASMHQVQCAPSRMQSGEQANKTGKVQYASGKVWCASSAIKVQVKE